MADLVGDIDPIKVAEGRSLGDPETIAFGLIPRAHRGIVAINELPDLAERIQVSMLNVMEERDIQVRGYTLRLPLDVRRRRQRQPRGLHQPRPHHHPAQGPLRRRDPHPLPAASSTPRSASSSQEAHLAAEVPEYLRARSLARFARYLRESPSIDQRSGVSARFAIAAAETVAAAARHRSAMLGEQDPVARVVDLGTVIDVLRGKLEFESGEEGREQAVLEHLLRRATADTAQRLLGGIDVGPLVVAIEGGSAVTTGERVSRARRAGRGAGGARRSPRCRSASARQSDGQRAAAVELALEALYLAKRDRQGVRRRNRLWLERRALVAVFRATPAGPIRWRRRSICARRSSRSARTSWRAARRVGRCSELMRRGTENMRGADKLAAEANRRRRELLQRNNLDGTLQEIKKLLDEAVLAERKELARALDDDARFNEMRIESLPPVAGQGRAGAVRLRLAQRRRRARSTTRSRICSAARCSTSGSPA